ncbi:MAG: DUF3800 domain-containing protein [Planctomycetes bacterium]|nr:DUF3800 domain-containing protein [Planctomycetota bacterium]
MHLLYLDASGTVELQDSSTHYVLAGIAIHESWWKAVTEATSQFVSRYRHGARPFELHAKELLDNIPEQRHIAGFGGMTYDQRRSAVEAMRTATLAATPGKDKPDLRKRYNRTTNVLHLTVAERTQCYEEALRLIASFTDVCLFCYAIDKKHVFQSHGMKDISEEAFMQVVSRFDYLVARRNAGRRQPESSMLVIDRDDAKEDLLKRLAERYRTEGHPFGKVEHVIEHPFFANSHESLGIQMADMVSHAVRRYLEKPSDQTRLANLRSIWPRFDAQRDSIHGIRHYAPKSCQCEICVGTGREN